jgi:Ca-activated chloride channel family protein
VLPNLDSGDASGRLDVVLIRDTVREHYDVVRQCYESGLARNPRLGGRITMRFAIERDGTTSGVVVSDNELADCAAVECVRAVIAEISFPPPEGGTVIVQYPIMLEPG